MCCLLCQELAFDQKEEKLLTIKHVARLSGCWTTFDPQVLSALSKHHVWTDAFLETRLKWRTKQPITVMELRVHQLPQPLIVPTQDKYWGCFSWIETDSGIDVDMVNASQPVVQDADYCNRQHQVRTALSMLHDCTAFHVKNNNAK